MMSDYQLWQGDCLTQMDRIEAGSVDAIIADLPYGTTDCAFDIPISLDLLWKHYKRVIKKNGSIVLTASQPFNYLLYASNPTWYRYEWVWDKKLTGGVCLC